MPLTAATIKELATIAGFEICGVTQALPLPDFNRYQAWRNAGLAGDMTYLTDHRGDKRSDPRHLLPSAQTIVCLGKLYNTAEPYSTALNNATQGWISRYAWGDDYHEVLKTAANHLLQRIRQHHPEPFDWKICIDTAPLLERSYARAAGLGWIGKNTCLINQQRGSWFLLAELLLSLPLETDSPAPDRCGTCTRCIDACPTEAIVPDQQGGWLLDARLCISYLTIEKRGSTDPSTHAPQTNHIFGCDICQDVCPWNRRAPATDDLAFAPQHFAPHLADLALLSEDDFRRFFRHSPVFRTKYEGFLRNVAIALGNSGKLEMREPLQKLASHPNAVISTTARQALLTLEQTLTS